MRFIKTILFLFLASVSYSQQLDPVKWSYEIDHISGNEYELTFEATIDKGWTVYSQYIEGDGPTPTSINYETKGIENLGKGEESGDKKQGFDKIFEIDVTKFLGGTPFVIKQKIKADKSLESFKGYLTFMTCDKEKCLPPTDIDFEFSLKGESTSKNQATNPSLLDPVSWDFGISKLDNGNHQLEFTANIKKGWTVYSQYTSDDGPVPTSINYETKNVEKIGKAKEFGHEKAGFDKIFEVDVIKFLADEPFVIKQEVSSSSSEEITGYLTYMTCDKEKCLAPKDVDFVFNLKNMTAGVKPAPGSETSGLSIAKPMVEGDFMDQRINSIVQTYEEPIGNCKGGESTEDEGLLMSFVFGFIGGLLALLTPCVFPMIPLTVSFFTKDTKRKGWVNGMIYGLSIIVIYVALGLILTAVFGPEALNRLSTNWIANTLFFIIFVVFAFSFFGYFEITLPSSWSTKSDTMADKGGFIGIFFMAFTLALVSFSCTGPIIGSAIVSAASNAVGPAVVMLGFAIALALPFGLFAAFPAWLNTLPQSGGWMTSVKVVLGFLELALAFKFLSVADMTNHWGFLKYELFMGAWVIIFSLMALYLFGIIRFPHDSKLKKLSPIRGSLGLLTVGFVFYLLTGFMTNEKTDTYNSLGLLSGLAPPAQYSYFKPIKEGELNPALKAKYSSYTMCANNIPCFKDYYEGLTYAREVNKMVFLDFTGFGCVNCRKVEEHIWVDDNIRSKLSNDAVLISLYVDSDKKLDDIKISKRDGKTKIRNVGRKWADFQIVNFGQNTQPLYVMMTPDEKVIAKPRGYRQNEGIEEYNEYMDCGINTFQEIK